VAASKIQRIDFSAKGITVDGAFLGFPLTTFAALEALGPARPTKGKEHAVRTWDEHGLKSFGPLDGTLIATFDVYVSVNESDKTSANPTHTFAGEITVDGVPVDAIEFLSGFDSDKLYIELGPYMLSRAFGRASGSFYDFFIRRDGSDYFTRKPGIEPARQELVVNWKNPEPGSATHTIDFGGEGIILDGKLIELPAEVSAFAVLGESSADQATRRIWNDLGIVGELNTRGLVESLVVFDGVGHEIAPSSAASTTEVTIAGAAPAVADWTSSVTTSRSRSMKIGGYEIERAAFPGRMSLSISALAQPLSLNDYTITPLAEPILVFTDFNAKLQVIEELMYKQGMLTPRFDVRDFARWYTARQIDIEAESFAVIPEALAYFRDLPIPSRLAYEITSLYIDGGSEIFHQIYPQWDGEDDTFDLHSVADYRQFPNLKKLSLMMGGAVEGRTTLEMRGVTIED